MSQKRGHYIYLYVILDIFSRYVASWMVAERESAGLAKRLIGETGRKQNIAPHQLTLHADRGSSMTSQPVALLLADPGVTQTHSRPHVSDDNPFWESQFKTLKYRPEFPERFGSIQDARAFCQSFFPRYNAEHHHSGSRPAHARGAPRRTGRRGHRPTPGGPQPGFPKKSRTLRPGAPPTPGATCCGMDQPSARTGRERTAATRIYAGRCLKVIDKFRTPGEANVPVAAAKPVASLSWDCGPVLKS